MIIDFYLNEHSTPNGLYLQDILNFTYEEFEKNHTFIQWLFPTDEQSNFHPEAPVLTKDEIVIMQAQIASRGKMFHNFFDAVDNFLLFLGIKSVWVFDTFCHFELTEDFSERSYTWLTFNHNALRITRMFKCLSLMGFGKGVPGTVSNMGAELLDFMKTQASAHGARISDNTLGFWEAAVFGYDK